jgi:Domain of Unknown Function (DUF928)
MSKIHITSLLCNTTKPKALGQSPRFKSMLSLATVSGAIFLPVAIAPVFSIPQQTPNLNSNWQIAQIFRPPNRGAPRSTEGAGTRGSCISSPRKLTPLTPALPGNNLGLTVSAHPTFFAYIPRSSATSVELIIKDKGGQEISKTTFGIPTQAVPGNPPDIVTQPGIVSITLPSTAKPLEIGKMYQWQLVLVCSTRDPLSSEIRNVNKVPSKTAWIERIQPSATLTNQLQNTTPTNLPALYANAGIWHEALATRAKLRATQPKSLWERNWQQLLRTAGLRDLIQEPIIDCCQVTNP